MPCSHMNLEGVRSATKLFTQICITNASVDFVIHICKVLENKINKLYWPLSFVSWKKHHKFNKNMIVNHIRILDVLFTFCIFLAGE